MKISILMLVYNAPKYVLKSILSLQKTVDVDYELIVVDNNSRRFTKLLCQILKKLSYIDKLYINDKNSLFAGGNNIAATLASKDTTHYLLLNSDVKVVKPNWLKQLCSIYPDGGGICSFGAVLSEPIRADGYCMMIGRELYDKYRLDESYEWWWSVTKLESQILQEGYSIKAVRTHDNLLIHYGGASGKGYVAAKGMNTDVETIKSWFSKQKHSVEIINNI